MCQVLVLVQLELEWEMRLLVRDPLQYLRLALQAKRVGAFYQRKGLAELGHPVVALTNVAVRFLVLSLPRCCDLFVFATPPQTHDGESLEKTRH